MSTTASIRGPEAGAGRRRRAAGVACFAAALALFGLRAEAELVILTDGSFFKVAAFEATNGEAVLDLPGGGRVRLPIERVERVIDDEVVPEPEEAAAEIEEGAAGFPIRFAEGQRRPATSWGDLIFETARRHEINPELVVAVVRAESGFDARAVSNKGARGLMQLMPATGQRFGLRTAELYDPAKNLDAGVRYLRWLADRFDDDLARVLAGYNAGEGSVDRYGGVPPYRETQGYIRKIYAFLGLEPPPR
ncbi:MAG: lytic transglycosylase domain-containing protein [Holophagales bacterium]|nr:lytic transglycosylase domain-containing protein [Holophagales bacterium]